jgi:hypothetical protein
MNPKHQELYQRLEAFPLNESGATFPFSKKLAKENNWSLHSALQFVA